MATRVVLAIPNRELRPPRAGRLPDGTLNAVKRAQGPLAMRDFRFGIANIPFRTGRLRRSLRWRITQRGISIVSRVPYWFVAIDAVRNWWRRFARARFHRAVRDEAERRRERRRERPSDPRLRSQQRAEIAADRAEGPARRARTRLTRAERLQGAQESQDRDEFIRSLQAGFRQRTERRRALRRRRRRER